MISGIAVRRCFWKTVFIWNRFRNGLVIAIFQPQPIFMHIWIAVPYWFRLMQCWMVWEWILNKKASSWKSTTDLFLRRWWDLNPRTGLRPPAGFRDVLLLPTLWEVSGSQKNLMDVENCEISMVSPCFIVVKSENSDNFGKVRIGRIFNKMLHLWEFWRESGENWRELE